MTPSGAWCGDILPQEGLFVESAEVFGNLYGTSFQAVRDIMDQGKVCILDVDGMGWQSFFCWERYPCHLLWWSEWAAMEGASSSSTHLCLYGLMRSCVSVDACLLSRCVYGGGMLSFPVSLSSQPMCPVPSSRVAADAAQCKERSKSTGPT